MKMEKLSEEDKIKFKEIPKFVWDGLHETPKTITELETERNEKYKGDSEQLEFKNSRLWFNKKDMDDFVARKLNINPNKWGTDKSKNRFYKEVAKEISHLRDPKGKIVDWKFGFPRYGIWRLVNSEEEQAILSFEDGNYSCPVLESSVVRRTKQEKFRRELIKEYDCKCIFCGFGNEAYLRAAHIVPFIEMQENDPENAMNPRNGLLLCALCDIAFERGDIIVNENYQIIQTDELLENAEKYSKNASWILDMKEKLEVKESSQFKPETKYLKWKMELNYK